MKAKDYVKKDVQLRFLLQILVTGERIRNSEHKRMLVKLSYSTHHLNAKTYSKKKAEQP